MNLNGQPRLDAPTKVHASPVFLAFSCPTNFNVESLAILLTKDDLPPVALDTYSVQQLVSAKPVDLTEYRSLSGGIVVIEADLIPGSTLALKSEQMRRIVHTNPGTQFIVQWLTPPHEFIPLLPRSCYQSADLDSLQRLLDQLHHVGFSPAILHQL